MAAQGVVRVGHEVDQYLVQLVGIGPQHRQVGREVDGDLDAVHP